MIKEGIRYILLSFILVATLPNQLHGQKGQELGGWIGVAHYFGDLNTDYSLKDPGPSLGLRYRRNFNERICLAGELGYARISGDDSDAQNSFENMRNLSFASNVFDAAVSLEFNFFTYVHGDKIYNNTPYAFAGIVASKYNPTAELDGTRYDLRDFGTEGQGSSPYSLVSGGINFGIGYKWDLNRKWSFNVSLAARRLLTDYIDDVSGVYPNNASLPGGPFGIAAQLSDRSGIEGFTTPGKQRGNPQNNDTYAIFGFSIMRYFSQLECPAVSRIKY